MFPRIILFVLISTNAHASDFTKIQAPWLEILPAGVYESKPADRGALRVPFSNTPKGKQIRANPNECSALELQNEMAAVSKDAQSQSKTFQDFMRRCDETLRPFSEERMIALLRISEGNYPLEGRTNLREIVLHLPYKTNVHGLLAMKDTERPRPMLIMICGSGCNLSDSSARFFLTQAFDTMPFNVLVLPSLSGSDFIKDNRGFGLGGFEEGRQTFEVVRLLGGSDSPFKNLVTSFHILGISLGGNGALFTSAYGSFNNQYLAGPKINSVIGLCPVVDLKASLMDLDRDDPTGNYFTGLIGETILKNFAYVFGSSADMPTLYKPGHKQSVPFLEKYIYPRYKILSQIHDFQLAPMTQADLDTPETFWSANNFLNYSSRITVPTLVMYSEDDFIVSPKLNSQALAEDLIKNPNPLVNVVGTQKGSHCGTTEIYGDDVIDGALQNFVLSQSPEFDYTSGARKLDLSQVKNFNRLELNPGEKFFGYEFEANKGKNTVALTLKIWNPNHTDGNLRCSQWDPYHAFEGCFREVDFDLPVASFFPYIAGKVSTKAQAQALTRWLNRRVSVTTKLGTEPVDTTDFPSAVKWTID
jgi:predicted alpha/beta-fold hydrolase